VAVATYGVGKALKAATITEVIPKLKTVPYIADKGTVVAKLDNAVAFAEDLATTKMCFVAGTAVLTAGGPRAIETIRPGDLVLSRDEASGEQAYKPVLETVVTRPTRLYHVGYRTAAGIDDELVGTGEHPFFVTNRSGFVRADELAVGDTLRLADGGPAEVTSLNIEEAVDGGPFTTYNFEVADFHTYFVGEAGVWVHNASTLCEKAFSIYNRQRKYLTQSAESAFTTVETVLKKYIKQSGVPDNDPIYIQELGDVLDDVFKKDINTTGADFWNGGPFRTAPSGGGRNAYSHYVQHVLDNKSGIPGGEFPDVKDAVSYVKLARSLLDTPGSNCVPYTNPTTGQYYVFDKVTHLFATEIPSGGSGPGLIKTFFRGNMVQSNGTVLTPYQWYRNQGYGGPAF